MEDEAALKIKRQKALTAVSASMAVIIQVYDLALSAEIIADATEKYGKDMLVMLVHYQTISYNNVHG